MHRCMFLLNVHAQVHEDQIPKKRRTTMHVRVSMCMHTKHSYTFAQLHRHVDCT
eukprot:m.459 g.459  ORF g.459 m.459 type:complete len:54 (-) comp388_c0_seq1:68-229(-)